MHSASNSECGCRRKGGAASCRTRRRARCAAWARTNACASTTVKRGASSSSFPTKPPLSARRYAHACMLTCTCISSSDTTACRYAHACALTCTCISSSDTTACHSSLPSSRPKNRSPRRPSKRHPPMHLSVAARFHVYSTAINIYTDIYIYTSQYIQLSLYIYIALNTYSSQYIHRSLSLYI